MATGIIANNFYVLYNKQNVLEKFVYENYYRDVVYYILDSKLSADRKLKLIFNLIFL